MPGTMKSFFKLFSLLQSLPKASETNETIIYEVFR